MAATQCIWVSGTGIYSSTASWVPQAIPGAGGADLDSAIFDGTSQHDVIGETPGGNALSRIITKPTYKGNIGAPGNPLTVVVSSPNAVGNTTVLRGRGNAYIKSPAGQYMDVVVDTGTQDRVVSLDGQVRHVFIKSGKVELLDTLTTIYGIYVLSANCYLTIAGDSATFNTNASLVIRAGIVDSKEDDWPRIEMHGGHLIQRGLLKGIANGVDVTMFGGWLEYKPTLSVSGHNPDLHLFGGTLDLRGLNEDLTPADIIIGPNAVILGNALGQADPDGLGGGNVQIDLREDYP